MLKLVSTFSAIETCQREARALNLSIFTQKLDPYPLPNDNTLCRVTEAALQVPDLSNRERAIYEWIDILPN